MSKTVHSLHDKPTENKKIETFGGQGHTLGDKATSSSKTITEPTKKITDTVDGSKTNISHSQEKQQPMGNEITIKGKGQKIRKGAKVDNTGVLGGDIVESGAQAPATGRCNKINIEKDAVVDDIEGEVGCAMIVGGSWYKAPKKQEEKK